MHKKAALAITGILLVSPFLASAQQLTTIQALEAQIQALMAQLQALSQGTSPTGHSNDTPSDDYPQQASQPSSCPDLTYTLKRGSRDASTGGQVSGLQVFLANHFNLGEETLVGGYFGARTEQYVKRFQTENGLPSFGIVGSLTRAKIVQICGGMPPVPPVPPTPPCDLISAALGQCQSVSPDPTKVPIFSWQGPKEFNGTDTYVSTGRIPDSTAFTIGAWVFYTGTSCGTIFSDADGAGGNDMWIGVSDRSIIVRNDKNGAQLAGGSDCDIGYPIPLQTSISGSWHHVAWSNTGNSSTVFLDGSKVQTVNIPSNNIGHHNATPSIGRMYDMPGVYPNGINHFKGYLASIVYYAAAMSDAQVVELYSKTPKPQTPEGCSPWLQLFGLCNFPVNPPQAITATLWASRIGHCSVPFWLVKPWECFQKDTSFFVGGTVFFQVKVLDNPGSPFTPEEGAEVRINQVSASGSINDVDVMQFNANTGYYELSADDHTGANDVGTWTATVTVYKHGNQIVTSNPLIYSVTRRAEPFVAGSFTATPTSGEAPLEVRFGAKGSSSAFIVYFGDGQSGFLFPPTIFSEGSDLSHVYSTPGTYTAQLSQGVGMPGVGMQPTTVLETPISQRSLGQVALANPQPLLATTKITVTGTSTSSLSATPASGQAPLTVTLQAPTSVQDKMQKCKYSYGWYGSSGNGLTIDWGDGVSSPSNVQARVGQSCTNEVTSHTYATPGSYTIKAESWHPGPTDAPITDWVAMTSITVGNATSAPSISLTSPISGRTFTQGNPIPVMWSVTNMPSTASMYIQLVGADGGVANSRTVTAAIGTSSVATSGTCNGNFSDGLMACDQMMSGTSYKIRARIFTPQDACLGYTFSRCQSPTILASAESGLFSIVPPTGAATGSAGANAASSSSTSTRLVAVGVYSGSTVVNGRSSITVNIAPGTQPLILSLSAFSSVDWVIVNPSGRAIQRIFATGYHSQTVTGHGTTPLETYSYDQGTGYVYAYSKSSTNYTNLANFLKIKTGLDISDYQGTYQASSFTTPSATISSTTSISNLAAALAALEALLKSWGAQLGR